MAFLPCLLVHTLPVDPMIKTVFFTWKVDHTFCMDSTVCFHDAPGGCGIDPQVYSKDPVSKFIFILHEFPHLFE